MENDNMGNDKFSAGRRIEEPKFVPAERDIEKIATPKTPLTQDAQRNQDGGVRPWKPKGRK